VRGLRVAVRDDPTFTIHLLAAIAVIVLSALLQVSRWEWCLLTLCIAAVITAELFNTSLERMAKAISNDFNAQIRDALDISSGAVLAVSVAAAIVGCIIWLPHLLRLGGWG
jgi:diacylglycerol kinase